MTQHQGLLCPACRTDLVMTERQTIEIDYCPKCRGVWLDRGELDKIVERSAQMAPAAQVAPSPPQQSYRPEPYRQEHGGERGNWSGHGKPYRRKSWLEEIFD